MGKTLKIKLTAPSDDLIHKWRNFGEAVYHSLYEDCEVSIKEIDASTSQFHLTKIHTRDLRRTAARVRKIAEEHYFSNIIDVSEIPETPGA